jgi:hypothetical protein
VQDFLLDCLQDLLAAVIRASSSDRIKLMREFVCKVDEVSVTLQKHLRKEEEQLFPLLLMHFSFEEQAELVVRSCQASNGILIALVALYIVLIGLDCLRVVPLILLLCVPLVGDFFFFLLACAIIECSVTPKIQKALQATDQGAEDAHTTTTALSALGRSVFCNV